jgi:hypothetical protein
MATYVETITFVVEDCFTCGVQFGVSAKFNNNCRRDGRTFYCPNGHTMVYTETSEMKLQRELKKAQDEKDFYEQRLRSEEASHAHTTNRLSATKGALTRTKKRIANGACPCCKRQFVDLHRHMTTKHPDYTQAEPEPSVQDN